MSFNIHPQNGEVLFALNEIALLIHSRNYLDIILINGKCSEVRSSLKEAKEDLLERGIAVLEVNRNALAMPAFIEGISSKKRLILCAEIDAKLNDDIKKKVDAITCTKTARRKFDQFKAQQAKQALHTGSDVLQHYFNCTSHSLSTIPAAQVQYYYISKSTSQ